MRASQLTAVRPASMRRCIQHAMTGSRRHPFVGNKRALCSQSSNADIAHQPHTHTRTADKRVTYSPRPQLLNNLSVHTELLRPSSQLHRQLSSLSPALSPPLPPDQHSTTSSASQPTTAAQPASQSPPARPRRPCPHCSKTFASRESYIVHQIEVHRIAAPGHFCQPCPHCQQLFANRARLQEHINQHTGEKPYPCPHCGVRYSSRSSLTFHLHYAHDGPRRYTCIVCDGAEDVLFHTRQQARQHYLQFHHRGTADRKKRPRLPAVRVDKQGRERHVCPTCYMYFATAAEVQSHVDDEHVNRARPHRCAQCTAAFAEEYHLRAHSIDVHQQRPTDPSVACVECPVCGRLHSSGILMERHVVTHTAERPHVCEQCGAAFPRRDHRLRHLRVAHGVVMKRGQRSSALSTTTTAPA